MKTKTIKILALIISTICIFSCFSGCASKSKKSILNGMTIAEEERFEEAAFPDDDITKDIVYEQYFEKKEIEGTLYYVDEKEKTFLLSEYSSLEELNSDVEEYFLQYLLNTAFSEFVVDENEKEIILKVDKKALYEFFDDNGLLKLGNFDQGFYYSQKNKYTITITAERKFIETSFGELSEDHNSVTIVFTPDKEAAPDEIVIKYQ